MLIDAQQIIGGCGKRTWRPVDRQIQFVCVILYLYDNDMFIEHFLICLNSILQIIRFYANKYNNNDYIT